MEDTRVISDAQRLSASLGQLPDPMVKPAFIVVSGLPGTGKSYFCSKLAERLPFIILESDALRKTLFPSPTYSLPESSQLFQSIHHLIEVLLKKGIPLILDATNLSERYRERLYNIADRLNLKLILVRVEAPAEIVFQRLKARAEGTNPENRSGADWAVFQKMKPAVEKIRRNHYAVDTSRDITPVLDKIVREVNR
ncbi:MAG TPA: ATP-binding protein [Dehalococcoidales bacterium]|nr:ATP-binding protein [Dehalococcoidales bacterium]